MQLVIIPTEQFYEEKYQISAKKLQETLSYQAIWQDISWSKMILESGYANKIIIVGALENDELVGYGIFEKRSIGMGQFGLFCIGGPLGIGNKKTLDLFLKKCEEICQAEKCLFAQIEPLEKMESSWKTGAYKKFIELTTTRINLTFSEEEILAKMKPKGRYNIKVAEKNNVSVEWGKCTPENIKTFYSLLTETTKRDGFATNSLDYFTHLGNYIEKNNLGGILFASRENEILAAGIFIYYEKTALYYYGASVSEAEKRKYMASYLLQWEAIREGKKRGCITYDFLGIAPVNEPNHHLAGVTDFKLKLSPNIHTWPEAILYNPNPWKYNIFSLIKKIKNLGK